MDLHRDKQPRYTGTFERKIKVFSGPSDCATKDPANTTVPLRKRVCGYDNWVAENQKTYNNYVQGRVILGKKEVEYYLNCRQRFYYIESRSQQGMWLRRCMEPLFCFPPSSVLTSVLLSPVRMQDTMSDEITPDADGSPVTSGAPAGPPKRNTLPKPQIKFWRVRNAGHWKLSRARPQGICLLAQERVVEKRGLIQVRLLDDFVSLNFSGNPFLTSAGYGANNVVSILCNLSNSCQGVRGYVF